MSEEKPKSKKTMPKGKKRVAHVKNTELRYGEAYRTTKDFTWSNYDGRLDKVLVPAHELLIFRSFIPFNKKKKTELALFVWLERKITICLSVGEEASLFYVKHVKWEKRHSPIVASLKKAKDENTQTKPVDS